jgi:hypothetical protein
VFPEQGGDGNEPGHALGGTKRRPVLQHLLNEPTRWIAKTRRPVSDRGEVGGRQRARLLDSPPDGFVHPVKRGDKPRCGERWDGGIGHGGLPSPMGLGGVSHDSISPRRGAVSAYGIQQV